MPTYTVTDSATGKKYKLTGDSPPTETELTAIFGSVAKPPDPAPSNIFQEQFSRFIREQISKDSSSPNVPLGPRIIEIPTVGKVQFPSGMSDDEISAAIQRNYPQLAPKPQTAYDALLGKIVDSVKAQQAAEIEAAGARQERIPFVIGGLIVGLLVAAVLLRKLMQAKPWEMIPRAAVATADFNERVFSASSEKDVEFLAAAEAELVTGTMDKGTWARALVKAKGNEERRRAVYLVLRAKTLKAESR